MKLSGKEKPLRRTGVFPKFLSRSIAHGYDSLWNATTITSISSAFVNRNFSNYIRNELRPRLGHRDKPLFVPFCPYPFPRGVKTYQGRGGVKTYQVGSTPVLASYSRCSTPLNITKVIRRCDQSLAPTLRLEKLRVTTALAPGRRSASRLFSKLAVPKEQKRSRSLLDSHSRSLVTLSPVTLASNRDSLLVSRGNGGLS
jgi:hypothetical protein